MRRWMIGLSLFSLGLALLPEHARAQYRPSPRREEPAETDSFDDTMDPSRYRTGNSDWDTQELIAGGFRALHQDQVKILEKLDRLESRLNQLEKSRGDFEKQ